MPTRVIALGQEIAGDDGVGLAVVAALRHAGGSAADLELQTARSETDLVALLTDRVRVILVDAVLGSPAGRVLELTVDQLGTRKAARMSTHGLSVSQAIELARVLDPQGRAAELKIVAITIDEPPTYSRGLSAIVEDAIPRAVERVLDLARG